jgi:aspartate/methionine/tyrosine aminotransferase
MMTSIQTATAFSDNIRQLQPSATLAVSALARELKARGRPIIDLSAGEPDFDTPGFIVEAGIAAIRDGHTRYTPAPGLAALRRAIADFLAREHDTAASAAGVVVSAGAKQALFNALFALVGPGDRVLIPVPYWTSYPEIVQLARAEPRFVDGPEDRSYRVGPAELEAAWEEGVKALIINSPSNPSGSVYRLEELDAIARWARDRGVWLISDEIYARLCYLGQRAPGLLDLAPDLLERAVVINGASKAYAMTGWRIGFSYTDAATATAISALQSHITSNAATPSQHAALAAFSATPAQEAELESMAAEFAARRDLVVRRLGERLPGTGYVAPEGAFYLFFRADRWYDDARPDSIALCTYLIEEAEVALVPGAAFGDDRYVRLSFAASRAALDEAFDRLGRTLGRVGVAPQP